MSLCRYTHIDGSKLDEDLNVIRFNSYYRFIDVWVDLKGVEGYINDPTCMVISTDLHYLIHWFVPFFLPDLRRICRAHGLHPAQLTKAALKYLMFTHDCSQFPRCSRIVYVFRLSDKPRPHVYKLFDGVIAQVPLPRGRHRAANSERDAVQPKETRSIPDTAAQMSCENADIEPDVADFRDHGSVESHVAEETTRDFDHLAPLDNDRKAAIISEWEKAMSTEMLKPLVCAACSIRVVKSESVWVSAVGVGLNLLQNPYLPKVVLPTTYDFELYKRALLNPKGLEFTDRLGCIRLCLKCHNSLSASKMPKFALSNWLYYGHDSIPRDVRIAFEQSTVFERMLIGRARANSITCRFSARGDYDQTEGSGKDSILDQARKGVRGNVLVAPLDTIRMNSVIPPASESIRDTMCAMFLGNILPTRSMLNRYPPVLVRKSRVKKMITFLLANNPHYRPSDTFAYSERNLNQLFDHEDDEGLPSGVHIGFMPTNDAIASTVADYTRRNEIDACDDGLYEELLMENVGYTDGDDSPVEYLRMKTLALERCLSGKPFIASGTGTAILPEFKNPSILTWLFPHLDPWGIGGFRHPGRSVNIGLQEQLRHLLMVDGSPFERDPEFAFVFYNVCRKATISHKISFSIPWGTHKTMAHKLLSINPEVLVTLESQYKKNVYYRPTDDAEKEALKLLASLRMIARHVPGSDGYKTMRRNEIRGLMNHHGAPTLFVTLNPSDVDHPIVRLLAGDNIMLEDIERGEDLSRWKRSLLAAKNPSACAQFFHIMISAFIRIVLRHGRDGPGVYGNCVAYYGTVEAQGKGTLHCHMLLWLEGHLSPQSLKDKMSHDKDYSSRVLSWLDSIICRQFPNSEGIDSQKRKYPCRVLSKEFGNPHPGVIPLPSIDGKLSSIFWKEYDHVLESLIFQYEWHEHQATCWKYLERGEDRNDANCRMGMNGETHEVSRFDDATCSVILRRHHPRIASHTDVVLFLLQCNMDLKFIGSGEMAKAFTYYVTDYITKASLTVHAGMAALSYAIKKIHSRISRDVNTLSDQEGVGAIITSVNSMMGRQEISQPQVMSYLLGGGDYYTSHTFSILQWGEIRKFIISQDRESVVSLESAVAVTRTHVPPTIGISEHSVSMTLGCKSVDTSSQLVDYIMRSDESDFHMLCLYDFVSCTSKIASSTTENVHDKSGCFLNDEHPQFNTHRLIFHRKQRIPVLLGPKLPNPNKSTELKEDWARDMLALFKPWRTLSDLKANDETWNDAYDKYEHSLSAAQRQVIVNMQALTECREARDRHRDQRSRQDNRGTNAELEDRKSVV